jgi:hypothetical protein
MDKNLHQNAKAPMIALILFNLFAFSRLGFGQTYVGETIVDGVRYVLFDDGTASIENKDATNYNPSGFHGNINGTLTLHETVTYAGNDYTLTRIEQYAFYECENLTGQLVLPNTITQIGQEAFDGCRNLSGSLTLPPLLTEIAQYTFHGTKFTGDLVIPNAVSTIGKYAFNTNLFSSIDVGDGVTTISERAFNGTLADQVILGHNVTTVGDYAFNYGGESSDNHFIYIECRSVIPAQLGTAVFKNHSIGGYGSITVPCGSKNAYLDPSYNWTTNGAWDLSVSEAASQNVCIDGVYYQLICDGHTAKVLNSPNYSALTSVTIPGLVSYEGTTYTVIEIAANAFAGCNSIIAINIPSSITTIGDYAFQNCTGLYYIYSNVEMPNSITLGDGVFEGISPTAMLYVPFCYQYDYSQSAAWNHFAEIGGDGDCDFTFTGSLLDDNSWSNPENWMNEAIPDGLGRVGIFGECDVDEDVTTPSITINGNSYVKLTVKSGKTLTANNFIYNQGNAENFIIKDGAQVIHPNAGAQATVEKNITAYTPNTKNGWHLVSSPAIESFAPTVDNGFLANEYDLYFYDESEHYWRNYKPSGQYAGFSIDPLKGYLYANSANNTLGLTGTLRTATETVNVPLSYTTGIPLAGFNLVGNPFAHNVTTFTGSNVATEVYRMNQTMDEVAVGTISASNPLKPGEGFFVKATGNNASITFNANAKGETEVLEPVERPNPQASKRSLNLEPVEGSKGATIQLEITQNDLLVDRFILKRDGAPLEKFTLNENSTRIFATRDRQDWATIPMEGNEQSVSFKAAKDGTYTLRVNVGNMDLDYLHLIDNMTGADVDLLVHSAPVVEGPTQYDGVSTGSTTCYTFTAKTTDYESRFRLVFNADDASTGSASDAPFAFVNNGNIVITADAGDATLQVIDMMGRVIRTVGLSQCGSRTIAGMTPGVYVLRLIDGDAIKTQKMVIE